MWGRSLVVVTGVVGLFHGGCGRISFESVLQARDASADAGSSLGDAGQDGGAGDGAFGDGAFGDGAAGSDGLPTGAPCAAGPECASRLCVERTCGEAVSLTAGGGHTCALLERGQITCWGLNANGQLGLGTAEPLGDEPGEVDAGLGVVDLGSGRTARAVEAGREHTCALLEGGDVKCWGFNNYGQLGLVDVDNRGDGPGEMGDALPVVSLGGGRTAMAIAVGDWHTCALLDGGEVKCWGRNNSQHGLLGIGDTRDYEGDPSQVPAVDLGTGRTAVAITAANTHTCATLDNGQVKCWGESFAGQLGGGNTLSLGADPADLGDVLPAVELGTGEVVQRVHTQYTHTCALLAAGRLKCWGRNTHGQLGLGDREHRGDDAGEMGDALPHVDIGAAAAATLGAEHTCALLSTGQVNCWGSNRLGQLGIPEVSDLGDEPGEMGDSLASVSLTGDIVAVEAGHYHTCALHRGGAIRCWGLNSSGQLGLGDTTSRGEPAGYAGDLPDPDALLPCAHVDREGVTIMSANPAMGFPEYMLDGDRSTSWLANPFPAEIVLDLGAVHDIDGWEYEDYLGWSRPGAYEVYVSSQPDAWGSPVSAGPLLHGLVTHVRFAPVTGRYVRLRLLQLESNSYGYTSEIGVCEVAGRFGA